MIDCTGLREEQVLVALFNYSRLENKYVPLKIKILHLNVEMTETKAKQRLNNKGKYVDYFEGVCIKTDFGKFPMLSETLFDENMESGEGSMEKVVNSLRK